MDVEDKGHRHRANPVDIADAAFAATLVGLYGELRNNRRWEVHFDNRGTSHTSTEHPVIDESNVEQLSTYLSTYMPNAFNEVEEAEMGLAAYADTLASYPSWAELISDGRDI